MQGWGGNIGVIVLFFVFFFLNLLLRLEPLSDLKGHTKSFPLHSGSLKGFLFSFLFNLSWKGRENPAGDFLPPKGESTR